MHTHTHRLSHINTHFLLGLAAHFAAYGEVNVESFVVGNSLLGEVGIFLLLWFLLLPVAVCVSPACTFIQTPACFISFWTLIMRLLQLLLLFSLSTADRQTAKQHILMLLVIAIWKTHTENEIKTKSREKNKTPTIKTAWQAAAHSAVVQFSLRCCNTKNCANFFATIKFFFLLCCLLSSLLLLFLFFYSCIQFFSCFLYFYFYSFRPSFL